MKTVIIVIALTATPITVEALGFLGWIALLATTVVLAATRLIEE